MVRAFLNGVQGNMVRTFTLDTYSGVGPFARVIFDASPWGARGFLVVDSKFVSWFAAKFDEVDENAIGIQFGDSAPCWLECAPGYRSGSKDFQFGRLSLTVWLLARMHTGVPKSGNLR